MIPKLTQQTLKNVRRKGDEGGILRGLLGGIDIFLLLIGSRSRSRRSSTCISRRGLLLGFHGLHGGLGGGFDVHGRRDGGPRTVTIDEGLQGRRASCLGGRCRLKMTEKIGQGQLGDVGAGTTLLGGTGRGRSGGRGRGGGRSGSTGRPPSGSGYDM